MTLNGADTSAPHLVRQFNINQEPRLTVRFITPDMVGISETHMSQAERLDYGLTDNHTSRAGVPYSLKLVHRLSKLSASRRDPARRLQYIQPMVSRERET